MNLSRSSLQTVLASNRRAPRGKGEPSTRALQAP